MSNVSRGLSPPPMILEEAAEHEHEHEHEEDTSNTGTRTGSALTSASANIIKMNTKRPSPRGIVDAAFLLDEELKSTTCTHSPQETIEKEDNDHDDSRSHGDDTEYALSAIM